MSGMEEDPMIASTVSSLSDKEDEEEQVTSLLLAPPSTSTPSAPISPAESSAPPSVANNDVPMESTAPQDTHNDTKVTMDEATAVVGEDTAPPLAPESSIALEEDATPAESVQSPSHTLPADIEHILSLGANEPDEVTSRPTDYERVVREMRERAGFVTAVAEGQEAVAGEEETAKRLQNESLEEIEREMQAEGVERAVVVAEQGEEGTKEGEDGLMQEAEALPPALEQEVTESIVAGKPPNEEGGEDTPMAEAKPKLKIASADDSSDSDSSTSSSSSSSSGDSDSDESTAASIRNAPTSAAAKRRARKRPQPKKPSADSDLSDDDVNVASAPTTAHEIAAPEPELPTIQKLPEGEPIARFGKVESVVGTVVVLKADISGDYRVLDEGTVVCWEDRTVAGTVFETFGAVQQPFYALRFPAASPPSPEVFTLGRPTFYAPSAAAFVFTREIRNMKGSDASNVWDEEAGAAELEFSDDEAEQAYRRNMKADRKAKAGTPGPSSNSRGASAASSRPSAGLSKLSRPSHLPPRPADDPAMLEDLLARSSDPSLVGKAPPSGAGGRKMFERDTGKVGAGVEFEFSDDEMDGAPAAVSGSSASRGDTGRGRGRGGRGRGRGRGGGERGEDGDRRPVAPMPSRGPGASNANLPSRPAYDSQSATSASQGGYDPHTPQQSAGYAGNFTFGADPRSQAYDQGQHFNPGAFMPPPPPPPQHYGEQHPPHQPDPRSYGYPSYAAQHYGGYPPQQQHQPHYEYGAPHYAHHPHQGPQQHQQQSWGHPQQPYGNQQHPGWDQRQFPSGGGAWPPGAGAGGGHDYYGGR